MAPPLCNLRPSKSSVPRKKFPRKSDTRQGQLQSDGSGKEEEPATGNLDRVIGDEVRGTNNASPRN